MLIPLADCAVQAGFPSPADDHFERRIDLNVQFIRRPPATFLVRVEGESMRGGTADIRSGDFLVVDKSLEAKPGCIVVVTLNGEFTVKRLLKRNGRLVLAPENENYPLIVLTDEMEALVWGVVVGRYTEYDRR